MPVTLVEQLEDSDAQGNITFTMHAQFTVEGSGGTFDATVPLTSDWDSQLIAEIAQRAAQVRNVLDISV